jgi:membrane-associated protease RseP (regulator of RpoE activity)
MDSVQFQRPKKFQHRYWLHILLLLVTLATTTWAAAGFIAGTWTGAFAYSVPILVILGAHEFGHYFACRYHDVDATLPFFIPAPPFVISGTFGAVIRIREAFPSKQALFDIGVAGPIAGFVALIPFLWWGLAHAAPAAPTPNDGVLVFGDPLLLTIVKHFAMGPMPPGDVELNPTLFAAWFGMLATALNLLPFGQLDGGHIAYAALGRHAKWVSIATLAITVSMTLISASWIMTSLMMLAMTFFLGVRHPRVHDEQIPLDRTRLLVALFAAVMFVLCFVPVPIQSFLR